MDKEILVKLASIGNGMTDKGAAFIQFLSIVLLYRNIFMKASLYIEKQDFDTFVVWINRLSQGVLTACPVRHSNVAGGLHNPVHLLLDADEYAMLCDAEKDIAELQKRLGGDLYYIPEPLEAEKIIMSGLLRNAQRYDAEVDLVEAALIIAMRMPGITPLEALVIAEQDLVVVKK